jgi:hypothetical protein
VRGDRLVFRQRPVEDRRYDLPCEVVLCRAETTAEHHQVRALEPLAEHVCQLDPVIADNGLGGHLNPQQIELLGDEE